MAAHLDYDKALRIMYITSAPVDGALALDVRRDIYSAVKLDWKNDAVLNGFKFPFRTSGGDTVIPGTQYIGNYVFLQYGWRMRPYEADHALYLVNGYLLVDGGGDPWLKTLGGYTCNVRDTVPADAIVLETGVSGLTSEESTALINIEADQSTIQADIATIQTDVASILVDLAAVLASQVSIEAEIIRALGLMQENYQMDQCTYVDYQGQKLLTSARVRLYSTDNKAQWVQGNLTAEYAVLASWTGQELVTYQVNRVALTTTTSTTTTGTTTTP
jgi:hypothetical protein